MEDADKQEMLHAIHSLSAHVDERHDGLEERLGAFQKETRERFDKVDTRLDAVEDEVTGMSTTLDTLIEGDVLGTKHVTLTRREYDSLMDTARLPNRFAHKAR